jgi:undecaprenyl-diphosphatase
MQAVVSAAILGALEGLTEFIPVSSTAHLILAGSALGFSDAGTFDILIQLGAILALLLVYAREIASLAVGFFKRPHDRHFVIAVVLAFLPAAVIGALAHDFIKTVLFESPRLICTVLIIGGIILIFAERLTPKPTYDNARDFSWPMAVGIGFFQCLAMVPGTSRSGATIIGALIFGASKRAAAEFSFFLAMPTMLGAFVFDLYKSRHEINMDQGMLVVIGFIVAFLAALIVVKPLLAFVSRRGYAPFGWWRIAVGTIGLIVLTVHG